MVAKKCSLVHRRRDEYVSSAINDVYARHDCGSPRRFSARETTENSGGTPEDDRDTTDNGGGTAPKRFRCDGQNVIGATITRQP